MRFQPLFLNILSVPVFKSLHFQMYSFTALFCVDIMEEWIQTCAFSHVKMNCHSVFNEVLLDSSWKFYENFLLITN